MARLLLDSLILLLRCGSCLLLGMGVLLMP